MPLRLSTALLTAARHAHYPSTALATDRPWHDRGVTTVLEYLVIAAAIGLVVFVIVAFVFGRGEQMAPLPPRTSPADLPNDPIRGEDVRRVRFSMGLRGYRMSDVDWTLDKVAEELDRLHRRVAELDGDSDHDDVPPDQAGDDHLFALAADRAGSAPSDDPPIAPDREQASQSDESTS